MLFRHSAVAIEEFNCYVDLKNLYYQEDHLEYIRPIQLNELKAGGLAFMFYIKPHNKSYLEATWSEKPKVPERMDLIQGIAHGLMQLHSVGRFYQDVICFENVLLDNNEFVILKGFGQAVKSQLRVETGTGT
jgi:hypothetical protein